MAKTNKTNTTGIMVRTDYVPYTDRIRDIVYFCASCDPEGKGGKGGLIGTKGCSSESEFEKSHCFCPTCGKKLDWKNKRDRSNALR